ncbi:MAG TPA: hypothetical protein VF208_03545, partial [Candidatus Binatia bacterium]
MQDRQDNLQAKTPLEQNQSASAIPSEETAWREPSSLARWSDSTSTLAWPQWERDKRPYYLPVKGKFLVSTAIAT